MDTIVVLKTGQLSTGIVIAKLSALSDDFRIAYSHE